MLPYSLDVYFSVVARMNGELWWAAMLAVLAATLVVLAVADERSGWIPRLVALMLALGWLVIGTVFYGDRMEPLFFGAQWFQWAYTAQAVLLALAAVAPRPGLPRASPAAVGGGVTLMLVALLVMPGAEAVLRDGWPEIRLVGLAPEPTLLFTCGWLLTRKPGWPVALLALIPLAGAAAAGYSAVALHWHLDWVVVAAAVALFLLPGILPPGRRSSTGQDNHVQNR